MSETGKIEALKQNRTRERVEATKSLNRLKVQYQATDADPDDLAYLIHLNEKQLAALEQLGEELERFEVHDDSSHATELEEWLFKSKRRLERLEKTAISQPSVKVNNKFKLDLHLPKYGGDLLAWPEFWELYTAAVHHNTIYSAVEKFVYLRGHLTGEAARSIQGLATTDDNYQIAVDILKDRFGKDDVRKEALMANLLHLPALTNADDLKSMRRLTDDLTANVRALAALGTSSATYGELLLPVLKGKVPVDWRLQWARSRGDRTGSDSEFTRFVRFLQDEMRVREEASIVPCIEHHHLSLHREERGQPPRPQALGIAPHATPYLPASTTGSQPEGSDSQPTKNTEHTAPTQEPRISYHCHSVMDTDTVVIAAERLEPAEMTGSVMELKGRSHGGEPVPCPEVTQKDERERTVPDALPDADGGWMPPDLGMKLPPPEPPCCSLREGSGITPVSNLSTPLEHDPSNASYLPHRGLHRNGNLRLSFDGTRRASDQPTLSKEDTSTKLSTLMASWTKEKTWLRDQTRNPASACRLRNWMPMIKTWKRKRWKDLMSSARSGRRLRLRHERPHDAGRWMSQLWKLVR